MTYKEILGTYRQDLFIGKTILVSGGTSGIGLAIAQGFAGLGGTVIATGSNADKIATEKSKQENSSILFEQLDVRDNQAIRAFAANLPSLDVLVNAQGIVRGEAEHTEDVFLEVIDVNLSSVMRLCIAFREHLARSKGNIINVASMLQAMI